MRKVPSRMTLSCPLCTAQIVVQILMPTPAHRDTKHPRVLAVDCPTPGCGVQEEHVRELLHIPSGLDKAPVG